MHLFFNYFFLSNAFHTSSISKYFTTAKHEQKLLPDSFYSQLSRQDILDLSDE